MEGGGEGGRDVTVPNESKVEEGILCLHCGRRGWMMNREEEEGGIEGRGRRG